LSLESNVCRMNNSEINNLAKNRFIGRAMQEEILQFGNRTALGNLCRNSTLTKAVRDKLWDLRGYVFKTELLKSGHYEDDQERYRDVYFQNKKKFYSTWGGRWRLRSTFLHSYWHVKTGHKATPSDVLDDIADNLINVPNMAIYDRDAMFKAIISHENLLVNTCVKLTTVKNEPLKALAFERLVTLNRERARSVVG